MGNQQSSKSSPKSRKAGAFVPGDSRIQRGRGPKKGAPNAGRPPSEVAALCRLGFFERIPLLLDIADSPAHQASDRLRAIDMLAKYGGMTSIQHTGADGDALPVPVTILETRPL
jgi:hypothetical protein